MSNKNSIERNIEISKKLLNDNWALINSCYGWCYNKYPKSDINDKEMFRKKFMSKCIDCCVKISLLIKNGILKPLNDHGHINVELETFEFDSVKMDFQLDDNEDEYSSDEDNDRYIERLTIFNETIYFLIDGEYQSIYIEKFICTNPDDFYDDMVQKDILESIFYFPLTKGDNDLIDYCEKNKNKCIGTQLAHATYDIIFNNIYKPETCYSPIYNPFKAIYYPSGEYKEHIKKSMKLNNNYKGTIKVQFSDNIKSKVEINNKYFDNFKKKHPKEICKVDFSFYEYQEWLKYISLDINYLEKQGLSYYSTVF